MDELMINLFSLIADQVRNKQELFDNEGKIMQMLLNNGYRIHEADAALMLIQTFAQRQPDEFFAAKTTISSFPCRVMNREERERFSVDAFGFATKLTRLGIVSESQREEIVERALTICTGRIELNQMKSLVALTLFNHPLEQDVDAPANKNRRHIKRTAWN